LKVRPTIIRIGFSEEELWQRLWQLILGLLQGAPLALGPLERLVIFWPAALSARFSGWRNALWK
jgi:hypothetical protein